MGHDVFSSDWMSGDPGVPTSEDSHRDDRLNIYGDLGGFEKGFREVKTVEWVPRLPEVPERVPLGLIEEDP